MTATLYTIANVQHSLMALKEKIPPHKWAETPLPVIAAPSWWFKQVAEELGVADDDIELESIHGCSVVRKDELPEPCLIDHDGKVYPLQPAWLKAKEAADSEGGEA